MNRPERGKQDSLLTVLLAFAALELLLASILLSVSSWSGSGPSTLGYSFWFGTHAPIREIFELTSFISTTSALLLAIAALFLTRRQLSELVTQNKNLATSFTLTVYREVVDEWETDQLAEARRSLNKLAKRVQTRGHQGTAVEVRGFVDQHLQSRRTASLRGETKDDQGVKISDPYDGYKRLLDHLEEVGILVRKNYIEVADVMDDIGESLVYSLSCLLDHIKWRRNFVDRSETVYANALWLYRICAKHEPFKMSSAEADELT